MIRGQIYALDLGRTAGFCKGPPGSPPVSGSVTLYRGSETIDNGFANFIAFLSEEWQRERPEVVVVAAPFSIQAAESIGNSPEAVYSAYGYRAILRGMRVRFGVRHYKEIHESTVRKHFTGKGSWGSREDTKAAVLKRARLIQLIPADCNDTDRADACAVHDWACATYGGRALSTEQLFLIGEGAEEAKNGNRKAGIRPARNRPRFTLRGG